MSNYSPIVNYAPKDALTPGDPAKKIKGVELAAEFTAIATMSSTKQDTSAKGASNGYAGLDANGEVPAAQLPAASETVSGIVELATTAEVVTGTDTVRAVTPAGVEAWAAQNAGMVQDIANLADPAADRLLFWDDSAGAAAFLTPSSDITISGTSISVNDAVLDHDSLTNFVANEHIDHGTVSMVAGNGLTGGGQITASRTFNVVGNVPIIANTDSVDFDIGTLLTIEGNALTGSDQFYIDDNGVGKRITWQGSGVPVTTTSAAVTPTDADANRAYVLTGATNRAFTLNSNIGVVGNFFILTSTGTGLWTFAGTSTRNSAVGTAGIAAQYSVVTMLCVATSTWIIFGDAV